MTIRFPFGRFREAVAGVAVIAAAVTGVALVGDGLGLDRPGDPSCTPGHREGGDQGGDERGDAYGRTHRVGHVNA